jgi:hypothetical protein
MLASGDKSRIEVPFCARTPSCMPLNGSRLVTCSQPPRLRSNSPSSRRRSRSPNPGQFASICLPGVLHHAHGDELPLGIDAHVGAVGAALRVITLITGANSTPDAIAPTHLFRRRAGPDPHLLVERDNRVHPAAPEQAALAGAAGSGWIHRHFSPRSWQGVTCCTLRPEITGPSRSFSSDTTVRLRTWTRARK